MFLFRFGPASKAVLRQGWQAGGKLHHSPNGLRPDCLAQILPQGAPCALPCIPPEPASRLNPSPMSLQRHAFVRRPLLRALVLSACGHALLLVGVAVPVRPVLTEAPGVARVQVSVRALADAPGEAVGAVKSATPSAVQERLPRRSPSPAVRQLSVVQDEPVVPAVPLLVPVIPPTVGSANTVADEQRRPASSGVGGEGVGRRADCAVGEPLGGAHPEDVRHYRVALASAAKRFKRYPPLARERGWEGTAEMAVLLYAAHRRPEVRLIRSSGRDLLDAQAMEMLGQALRVAEVPVGLRGRDLRIELPVRFSLEDER